MKRCLMAVCAAALLSASPASAEYIQGYTDSHSYVAGDSIKFSCGTNAATYTISIRKDGYTAQTVYTSPSIVGAFRSETVGGWNGAGWPIEHTVLIPPTWVTGSYVARFQTTDGSFWFYPFAIRQAGPGTRSRIAFVMNFNTRNAYNRWGLKSLYWSGLAADPLHATSVTFARPYKDVAGRGHSYYNQYAMYSELEAAGYQPEYITEWDIHKTKNLLHNYDIVVLAGHHEYISRPVWDALQEHQDRGGHLAFFSTNDLWWQVRFEDNGKKMIGYRDFAIPQDPMYGVDNSLVTTQWASALLNRPTEALQGVSYQAYSFQFEDGEYIIQDASHWLFAGTGYANGQNCGSLMATSETDYFGPASPPILDVLMTSYRDDPKHNTNPPVAFVQAACTYYADTPEFGFASGRGGQVFASGSQGWLANMFSSTPDYLKVRQMSRNVIDHMLAAPPPPIPGDFNGDRRINGLDADALSAVLVGLPLEPGHESMADLDGDGLVTGNDITPFVRALDP